MDCNSNLHGYDTPDAMPSHRGDGTTSSLLRETVTRIDAMSTIEDPMHMTDVPDDKTSMSGSMDSSTGMSGYESKRDNVSDIMLSG